MINIGIVGAGGMGTVHHSNYLHLDGCAVTGVVDPMRALPTWWRPAAWMWWTSAPPPSSTGTT